MTTTRWAVLGTGAIVRTFLAALADADDARVVAVGSSDGTRARRFAAEHGVPGAGTYADVLADPQVDAVYIGTVHTTHAELTVGALRAGKPVLCEKPLGLDPAQTAAVTAAAQAAGLPVVEAYKYRFSPFTDALRTAVVAGRIGRVRSVRASFGFMAPTRSGRLFDPAFAGGAVYDVGGYPVSLAVAVARWSAISPESLTVAEADGRLSRRTGVETRTRALVAGPGFEARVEAAITRTLSRAIDIEGDDRGSIHADQGWGSGRTSASSFEIRTGTSAERVEVPVVDPFLAEARALAAAAAAGDLQDPRMPWADSTATARLLARWRAVVGETAGQPRN
jgi:predicted dehydrogenase